MAYIRSVISAGGLPVLFPYAESDDLEALISHIDGLLLTGGGDVDPWFFAELPHPCLGRVNKVRDEVEIALCKLALGNNIPVLGICRGIQIMNTAAGGSLYQDLKSQWENAGLHEHTQTIPDWQPSHRVSIEERSILHEITNKITIPVNSLHHQAIKETVYPFRTVAKADDGVIEAIESDEHSFCLGVQWHPERMPDDFYSQNIFAEFIRACRENSTKESLNA
jgi:putative glutamine amidotransferase